MPFCAMLNVRPEQMAALRAGARQQFVVRLARFIAAKNYPAATAMDDARLLACVRAALGRAASHGIDTPSAQAAFVTLMFGIGPTFDRHPVIERILADRTVLADERMTLLCGLVTGAMWREARTPDCDAAWTAAILSDPAAGAEA